MICEARCVVPLSRTAARFRKGGCCDRKGPSNVTVKRGSRRRGDTESTVQGAMCVYAGYVASRTLQGALWIETLWPLCTGRDAFGAPYLRVTPCNRALASRPSLLLSLSLLLPLRWDERLSFFELEQQCMRDTLNFPRKISFSFSDLLEKRNDRP